MSKRSYTFTHAITRKPGISVTEGLRAIDTGTPSLDLFLQHHADYVTALKSTGAEVTVLEPLEEFPDSVFVEDAALCLPEGAIAMRPGTPSRIGEAAVMTAVLKKLYNDVRVVEGPGFIDGGDILTTETEILVGTSARTDSAGIEELRALVADWGYTVRELETPEGVLHFKTDCSLLDENTILSTKRLADSGCFEGYNVIYVAEGEEPCANSIRYNDLVIMPDGFPQTEAILREAGYDVQKVGNTEAGKLDGGMSCLSLRFSPPA
ncbi:dimethylarginine dimethylaminohydrolase family protein [Cochlodiniinecator piscidefendens]|uniref:dimethylarginine dimethylaminohydrolase family protein n=1 Tax=Cochlodiniinecator piscidefendens TaxID=2715756 RepID=UPI001407EB30|nr:arginine deiminase family protein [Cochlodiniinecator piscidefendens]